MDISAFNPIELNCEQWISTIKEAGARYAILVCKHHDGFANWPSEYTEYSVANTPWKNGKGDVVDEFVRACRKYDIKVGLYYSPAQFGVSSHNSKNVDYEEYSTYFINQITELLTNYGKIDYLWFDGCGSEGIDFGKDRIIDAIRGLEPDILIFNLWDPDTRWVGNELGNVQQDYAVANGWGDVHYGENCKDYLKLEDKSWIYRTDFKKSDIGDRELYFVSYGIDYECDIYINNEHLLHHIGMFEKIEINLTPYLLEDNNIEVVILPPPKDKNCKIIDRSQAAQAVRAAVSYGWDFHPRLIPTVIRQETYLEERGTQFVRNVDVSYNLNDELTEADVEFSVDCNCDTTVSLYDPTGDLIYEGHDKIIHINSVKLWWCNGQGNLDLYKYEVKSPENVIVGHIGFKKVELLMNEGAWEEPSLFPKTRSVPPMTISLNNRRIFAKGSNFIQPEIFYGSIDFKRYESLVKLARDANMNILRSWGGAIIHKKWFYELCDTYGIMVWQEFPLACNDYYATEEYLDVLEQEAAYIIKSLRSYACLVLWCGGNELFNRWSGMTEQSFALRLLNKLCYELDRKTPFIMTAHLMGMGHGHYMYYDKNINRFLKCSLMQIVQLIRNLD